MPQDRHHFSRFVVYFITSVLSLPAFAGRLIVQLDQRSSEATVHAALLSNQSSDWSAEPVAIASSKGATLIFEGIPAGRYAIQLFADLNATANSIGVHAGCP